MATKTQICNLAVSHLGIAKAFSDVDTDTTREAYACNAFYTFAQDAIYEEHNWSFALEYDDPTLVGTDPNDEWKYSYRYPTDCKKVIRVLSGSRVDSEASSIPYKIGQDGSGLLIFCDEDDITIEHIKDVDETYYPAQFSIAFAYRLAAYIAPRLTGGDPFDIQEKMLGFYQVEMSRAKANDMNQPRRDRKKDSPNITVRQ